MLIDTDKKSVPFIILSYNSFKSLQVIQPLLTYQ